MKTTEKKAAVKWYHLTPKAMRYMLAIKVYEEKLEELSKLSDEEITKAWKENRDGENK